MLVTTEKLIEGLKSPDTSSLILPDLLSLSDPFSGSVEEPGKGVCVCASNTHSCFHQLGAFSHLHLVDLVLIFLDLHILSIQSCVLPCPWD